MSATADVPPGPEVWRAQHLRLIAFPQEPRFAVRQDWWRGLTGIEPENVVERRQKQEREESGSFQGTTLTLGFDLLRIQWNAAPRLDAENFDFMEQPPVLGPFMERKEWFRALMEQWLPHCPAINRLAFSASLLQPVADHQAGYRMLERYLRWVEIDPRSSEFLYRINRRKASRTGIPDLTLNRLSTWTAAKFAVLTGVIRGGHSEQQLRPATNFTCAVDLDINTTPEYHGLLPPADLVRIFTELVEAAVEIATHGDARP